MHFVTLFSLFLSSLTAVEAAQILSVTDGESVIPNSYIVVMKKSVQAAAMDNHISMVRRSFEARNVRRNVTSGIHGIKRMFGIGLFSGYSGSFDHDTLDSILGADEVDFVEPNRKSHALGFETQQNVPSWGLARISHHEPGSRDYIYDSSAGEGITIYGVDSGIDINLPDFAGRITWGFNAVGDSNSDQHGHGTHTAGTFAGTKYGVAKKANIVAVKVLGADGKGANSGIIEGINWATNDAKQKGILGKAVMNLSLGGSFSQAVNRAVEQAAAAGVFVAVAAGNENQDASNVSPASAPNACTVGATDENDTRASFSNYGSVLDIFGPGVQITSDRTGGGTEVMSGTSMASPHIAGMGAVLMSSQKVSAKEVCDRLKQMADNKVKDSRGSTQLLAYNGADGQPSNNTQPGDNGPPGNGGQPGNPSNPDNGEQPNNPFPGNGGQPSNPPDNGGQQPGNPFPGNGGQPNNPFPGNGGQPNNPFPGNGGQPNNPFPDDGQQPENPGNGGQPNNPFPDNNGQQPGNPFPGNGNWDQSDNFDDGKGNWRKTWSWSRQWSN